MNKTVAIIIIILVLIGGFLYFRGGTKTGPVEPIKIGFLGPLSGDLSSLGESAKAAADLAVKEINDAGGVNGRKLELIAEDDQCKSANSTNAMTKLINIDKVSAIVGSLCSSAAAPAAPIAQAAKVPMINYCASAPGITKVGDYIFRDYPSDTFQSQFAAEYVFNTLKDEKVALIYINNDWGQGMHDGFAGRFEQLGGTIVYGSAFPQDARDFRTEISKIKQTNPDIIVAYAYTESGVPLLKQINEAGIKTPILGGDAWDDPTIPEKAGVAAERVKYTVTKLDVPPDFNEKLMAVTGKETKICAPQAYDAVKLIAKAATESGATSAQIRDGLAKITNYAGVSGKITFNADGDIVDTSYIVKVIKNGKAVEVK